VVTGSEKGNEMPLGSDNLNRMDRSGPLGGEASLLLAELQHRVANELSCAIAALRLALNAGLEGPRMELFERAVQRLEGFGRVHGVLAARPSRTVDVAAGLHRLCRGLLAGRDGLESTRVHITVTSGQLPGGPGHRLLMIAGELVFNGMRHALVGRQGRLDISVDQYDDVVRLTVSDDGPGIGAAGTTRGTGLGSGIVDELVRNGDGKLECDTDRFGTVFRVTLPLDGPAPVTWVVPETVA
jgi:two-component sensor histidine kinase